MLHEQEAIQVKMLVQNLYNNQHLPQSQSDTQWQNIKHKWKTMQINQYNLAIKKRVLDTRTIILEL